MLNKNCDLRPLAKDIIKTPYVVNHISNLLSYTLKKNNGGSSFEACSGAANRLPISNAMLPGSAFAVQEADNNPPAKEPDTRNVMDPELAEKQIEIERNRQKDEQIRISRESKEAKVLTFKNYL